MHHTHSPPKSHQPRPHRLLELILKHWALASVLCLSLQLLTGFGPALANNDYPTAGTLQLHHADGNIDAIQLDAHIDVTVTGLLAELTLTQQFQNTTDQWAEGTYLFPLNEESAIQGLVMIVGERTIHGQIMPKAEARDHYEEAKKDNKIASLVEQQRPNLFTMKAASIAPGEILTVKLDITLPVEVVDGYFNLRLPTTLTPRYTNSKTHQPDRLNTPFVSTSLARGPRISVNASIEPVLNAGLIDSQTHRLTATEKGFEIKLTPMDKDILIHWPMTSTDITKTQVFVSNHNEDRYVQIMMTPPTLSDTKKSVARELILVVDKSGSMAGVSMEAAREALHFAIDGLDAQDAFNIVAFDNDFITLFPESQPASPQAITDARRFTDSLVADGGTEMQSALSFAFKTARRIVTSADEQQSPARLKQVVFMTDGSVGYEDALLVSIKKQLGKSRLFTIGIGPAPNTWFIKKAAQVGRGTSLTIRDSHDVANAVTQLLSKLESPVMTDISIQYSNGYGEIYPSPIPDLYADKPGLWVSRISKNVDQIIITAKHDGKRISQTLTLPTSSAIASDSGHADNKSNAPAVAMHWARKKVASLLDEQRYASDPDLHKTTITDIAVDVGLVTPYTSFVAVDNTPTKEPVAPLTSHKVANLVPAGSDMMLIAMPQGAAGADSWTLLSLIFGSAGIALLMYSRKESCPSPERGMGA
ncbi:MAG: Ca-activated chloride channel family protein [Granulosicoccus sp.]|jgi:Ca-activated chloride channel family protein